MSRLLYLLNAYKENKISDEESAELLNLLGDGKGDHELGELVEKYWYSFDPALKSDESTITRSFETIRSLISERETTQVIQIGGWAKFKKMVIAAAVITAISTAAYFWLAPGQPQTRQLQAQNSSETTGSPGSDKAVLVLSNGSKIVLDSIGSMGLSDGGVDIAIDKGSMKYNASSKSEIKLKNTLTTPRGGQYKIKLADGTDVWLNAATRLTFPTSFSSKERIVELDGEAYFEVAKDPHHPFIVKVNDINVKVLGTSFNVMGYTDELSINTTLVEGRVLVETGAIRTELKPGQESIVHKTTGESTITNADISKALAWKNGFFEFENADIHVILRQISRWYDIDVEIGAVDKKKLFGGRISKNISLSQMIKLLQESGFNCKLTDQKLFIN
jgi:transmembrane sensor